MTNVYITKQEFKKLTSENIVARLEHANLSRENDIADFVKQTDFGDKLKNINKKVTSDKTRSITRCNNRNDLLHLSFTLKISKIKSFYCKNSKPLSIFTKELHRRCSLRF